MIVVDDQAKAYALNLLNAVPVKAWYAGIPLDSPDEHPSADRKLDALAAFLHELANKKVKCDKSVSGSQFNMSR